LGDYYLGQTGYNSQQTQELEDPNRPNNLWEPIPGDHGAHGAFDNRAHAHSYETWADLHRGWIFGGIAGAVALGMVGATSLGIMYTAKRVRRVTKAIRAVKNISRIVTRAA
jgi:hypothetical protein